jgi:endonuclease YncB( thermonuclease family)
MRYRKATLALVLLLPALATGGERCLAIDGDTLVCNRQKVRLLNVDAAELSEPGGAAAKRRLQALVRGRVVTLKPYGPDRYGRLLAEVYVGGRRIEQADIGPRRTRKR